MTEYEFDRVLRDALMEAMREDLAAQPDREEPVPLSRRQRRRMKKMLSDPGEYYWSYVRSAAGKSNLTERADTSEPVNFADLRRHKTRLMRLVVAVVIAAVLAGSALAYTLTGGEFFRRMFQLQAQEQGQNSSYMDTDQLLEMGGSNVGAVQDTKEFRFELVDAVSSGNSAMIAVRVTAKKMEDFPRETSPHYRNYSFMDLDGTLFGDGASTAGWHYVFSDEDQILRKNEFFLIFSVTSGEEIPAGTYTLNLHDFGYSDDENHSVVLYKGDWILSISLGDGARHSRTIEMNKTYQQDGCGYVLEDVTVTPLSLTMNFHCDSDDQDCAKKFYDRLRGTQITLKDGTVVDSSRFCCGCSSAGSNGHWTITVNLEFNVPLPVKSIDSVALGDGTIKIDLPAKKPNCTGPADSCFDRQAGSPDN